MSADTIIDLSNKDDIKKLIFKYQREKRDSENPISKYPGAMIGFGIMISSLFPFAAMKDGSLSVWLALLIGFSLIALGLMVIGYFDVIYPEKKRKKFPAKIEKKFGISYELLEKLTNPSQTGEFKQVTLIEDNETRVRLVKVNPDNNKLPEYQIIDEFTFTNANTNDLSLINKKEEEYKKQAQQMNDESIETTLNKYKNTLSSRETKKTPIVV